MLGREIQQALFPDNTYGVDSGGDPLVIPQLTFSEFSAFHSKFYHPSNSRLWFYGDDNPEERLRLLDATLSGFEPLPRAAAESRIAPQPLFPQPKRVTRQYAAGAEEAVVRARRTAPPPAASSTHSPRRAPRTHLHRVPVSPTHPLATPRVKDLNPRDPPKLRAN